MLRGSAGRHNEKTVRLAKGDELEVRLARLVTGYSWRVTKCDERLLDRFGEPVAESQKDAKPGSTEAQAFRYRAKAEGRSILA